MTTMTANATDSMSAWIKLRDDSLRPSVSCEPLRALGSHAMERFKELGFPKNKDEMFTYVNAKAVLNTVFEYRHGKKKQVHYLDMEENVYKSSAQSFIALIDGKFEESLSDISALDGQVAIKPFSRALDDPWLYDYLKETAESEKDIFALLNTAFITDGYLIDIADGASLDHPFTILDYYTGSGRTDNPAMSVSRIVIRAGENSRAVITLKKVWGRGNHFANSGVDFLVGNGASIECISAQDKPPDNVWDFTKMRVKLAEQSEFNLTNATCGSALSRSAHEVLLEGSGARFRLNSVSYVAGANQSHNYVRVQHDAPDCVSFQLFKNVVSDKGRTSVDSTVTANHGAVGTQSEQLINNLMLTDEGHADTKPNLMIYTDDVQCSHGATTGQLDDEQIFYLMTRGIDQARARKALTAGFISSGLQDIQDARIRRLIQNSLLYQNGDDHVEHS